MTQPLRLIRWVGSGWDDGKRRPEIIIARVEEWQSCRGCGRLHPYNLNSVFTDAGPVLFDSYEDAAHRVRQWLPDVPMFFAWESPDEGPPYVGSIIELDGRESAIGFLLRPDAEAA